MDTEEEKEENARIWQMALKGFMTDMLVDFQKMIIVMAKKKYHFDENEKENAAVKEIQNDMADCGFFFKEEQIIAYLKESSVRSLEFSPSYRGNRKADDICQSEK